MNKDQNATADKKETNCPTEGNCQVDDIVYKFDVTRRLSEKVYLGLAERAVSITKTYHLHTRGIPI